MTICENCLPIPTAVSIVVLERPFLSAHYIVKDLLGLRALAAVELLSVFLRSGVEVSAELVPELSTKAAIHL